MTTETTEQEVTKVRIEIPKPHSDGQDRFVRCVAKRQVLKAGRRWGKTVGVAIKALCAFQGICNACLGEGCIRCDNTGRVEPTRVLYLAPTAEQVGKFWYEVTEALYGAVESGALKKDETEKIIEVPRTEIRIKAKTAWNANTARGDFGGLVIHEEYQLMNEDVWNDVTQPMLLDKDGTAIFIFTPPSLKTEGVSKAKDPRHASKLYKKYENDKSGRWQTFHFTSYDNPTLSKDALKELTQSDDMSQDSYRREILAEDDEIQTSWLVYRAFNEITNKINDFEIPKNWLVYTAHDFGGANPAALFVAQDPATGDFYEFKEYLPGAGKSTAEHVEEFKKIICLPGEYGKEKPETYNVIWRSGGSHQEEEIRQGYSAHNWHIMEPKIKGVNAQVDRVIGMMERNKIFTFKSLYNLLEETMNCLWILDSEGKATDKIKDEQRFHLCACRRYLYSNFTPETAEISSKPKSSHSNRF